MVIDLDDLCPQTPDPTNADIDGDGVGDGDNCSNVPNPKDAEVGVQLDDDNDGIETCAIHVSTTLIRIAGAVTPALPIMNVLTKQAASRALPITAWSCTRELIKT